MRIGLMLVSILVAGLSAGAQQPGAQVSEPGEQAFVDWARQNAIPLKTVEAGHGFEDMAPVGKIVGDARIVELGEATHGTHEFFQMKHRMVEYLATREGFTIFSIEANMPEAYRLNDFVLNGVGDPKQLLKGMYFWTWNTEEVLDMILWMREFNRSGKGRIEFTGFDMQTPTVSLDNAGPRSQGHNAVDTVRDLP
ncbi:MAG: erythromycin esterase family protein [Silvibacterium sp.]